MKRKSSNSGNSAVQDRRKPDWKPVGEGRRWLVAYVTAYGSTRQVAEEIGKVLSRGGVSTDIRSVHDIEDIQMYDAVIIGSAIQYDRWMPAAINFVIKHKAWLSTIPVAFFFTCLTLSVETEKAKRQAGGYAGKLRVLAPEVTPLSIGQFAGVLEYQKLSWGFRQVARLLFKVLGVKEGDYRNWAHIRSWAQAVAAEFLINTAVSPAPLRQVRPSR